MANLTIRANAEKSYSVSGRSWSSWTGLSSSTSFFSINFEPGDKLCIRFPISGKRITGLRINPYFDFKNIYPPSITANIYASDPEDGGPAIAEITKTTEEPGNVSFDFSGISLDTDGYIYLVFTTTFRAIVSGTVRGSFDTTAEISYSYPPLTVEVLTPTAYIETPARFSFADSRGKATVSVTPYFGTTTPLGSTVDVNTDIFSITPQASWFTAAGATSDSMRVTLRCSDTLGRSNTNASFTLNRYGALTPTIVKPRSGQADAAGGIEFQWANSGEGEQVNFEVRWSTDQSNWIDMTPPRNGTEISFTTKAGLFPAGVIYWQVRVLDRDTGWSKWVQASFTAVYNVATVTLSRPTSGSVQGDTEINFDWSISANGGTITGTQMEISRDSGVTWERVVNSNQAITSYKSAIGQFTAGALRWRVRAKNEYQTDYADNWATANITISYTAASITLTSPTSGQRDGSGEIPFAWNIANGSGNIVKTIMEVSTDDGLSWTEKVNKNEKATSYTASAAEFPAGALKWRVKTKNQYQDDYTVSSTGSVTIVYSAVSQIKTVNSPTSGRVPASVDQTYAVALTPSAPVYTPFTIQSATMYWRTGTSGDYTAVSMTASGANASVVIAGGTFPSGTIQWYAEAVDNTGATRTTDVYTLLALNASVEAVPLSPINTIEGTSSEITFTWLYYSIDGTAQSRALLEYSRDGESWDTIADVPGSGTAYTAPAGFFTAAGVVYWRVQAFNIAGTAGPMSDPVSFIAFGAPTVSGVIGDGKPFLTVSWQTEGQQAYQVQIGGKTYGPYFGADVRSYTLKEPLADGAYTVRVRAQNRYGLWSEWTEGNVDVKNVYGPAVPFLAENGESVLVSMFLAEEPPVITQQPQDITTNGQAKLTTKFIMPNTSFFKCQWFSLAPGATEWQAATSEATVSRPQNGRTLTLSAAQVQTYNGYKFRLRVRSNAGIVYSREALVTYGTPEQTSPLITGYFPSPTGYFLIYRDGVLIGKTYNTRFYDRTALGTHEYYALQVIPDGYYTRSSPSTATATASVKCPMIGKLDGGDFIVLQLSTEADRAQDIQRSREVVHVHYSGSRFPTSEIGEAETLSVSFDTAWKQTDKAAADAFEALVGEDVIFKTPGGYVIVGTLEGYELHDPRFYKSYRCTLQQGDWRDYTNADA